MTVDLAKQLRMRISQEVSADLSLFFSIQDQQTVTTVP